MVKYIPLSIFKSTEPYYILIQIVVFYDSCVYKLSNDSKLPSTLLGFILITRAKLPRKSCDRVLLTSVDTQIFHV